MPPPSIRVVLADDHALFRQMLYHALLDEEGIEVVGEAANGREAINQVRSLKPDILLLDLDMPEVSGVDVAHTVVKECPATKVVVLTAYDQDEFVFQIVKAGATGYLLKDTTIADVIKAIRAAAAGEALIQPRIAQKILREFARMHETGSPQTPRKTTLPASITDREAEVLGQVAKGRNNREIAAALVISEPTVKTHVANLLHKLGLRDRVELVLFALQAGVVEPDPLP